MAFYLHIEYDLPAFGAGDIDIFSDPAVSMERTTAFWDILGAVWSTMWSTSPKMFPGSDDEDEDDNDNYECDEDDHTRGQNPAQPPPPAPQVV
ncbi:hypothetical protein BJ138DRAFT_1119870 [Hygrophoropsis aurantiaca]|uniref:Uncharacterized protein n=1 Tax=Hygrophoropsis aurantiaca TaxID=72124 RepID=A0ACB7ZRZ4_9AGAM|nr:hypothetical protein BJ138DRAFT_1119870 [Hygrophoropsis aurantiaca]